MRDRRQEIRMVARIWHGRTSRQKSDEYWRFLQQRAIPDYRSTPGNKGAWILRRDEGDVSHFPCLTHWESMDVIRNFAGDDIQQAKYYPEDRDFLLEFEPYVNHYEIIGE